MNEITQGKDGGFQLVTSQGRAISGSREALLQLQAAYERESNNKGRFLAAWKTGVKLAGPHLFELRCENVDAAQDKNDLRPNQALIADAIGPMSHGQRVLLIAMGGFFNSEWAHDLAEQCGEAAHAADVAAILDADRRQVIAELLVSYAGW